MAMIVRLNAEETAAMYFLHFTVETHDLKLHLRQLMEQVIGEP